MKAKDYEATLKQRLAKSEIKKLELLAKREKESLEQLRNAVTVAVSEHLRSNQLGFNEFTRQLGVSPSQTAKICKGEANLTIASIAHIAAYLGKRVRLIFD